MDRIKVGDKLFFQRSDGRVHMVTCTSKNMEVETITGEWTEDSVTKGKEMPLCLLIDINRHIFQEGKPPTQALVKPSAPSPSAAGSLIPKPQFGGGGGGGAPQAESGRQSLTGNPYAERSRVLPPSCLPQLAPKKTQILPVATNRTVAGAATARVSQGSVPLTSVRNGSPQYARRSSVVHEVNRMKQERELRRARQAEQLLEKDALRRKDPGNPNWEVALMLRQYRESLVINPLRCLSPHGAGVLQITVCVRKRPMSRREERLRSMDIITVPSPDSLIVHELRYKVDLTKFLEHHKFRFDYTFDEECSNSLVYDHTARPLIRTMFEGGNATCFAYGQTGSGKTHTMGGEFNGKVQDCGSGIYAMAARDVFEEVSRPEYRQMGAKITCSYFEIYGSKVFDLLHPDKPMLRVLEDGRQQVVVVGLKETPVTNVDDVLRLIELGNKMRTSGQTSANAKSSRSHAVFQMSLHKPDSWGPFGKCSFVDLAGNERGADTQSADRQTRIEGAEINKSLLALKECIRALSRQSSHLPFRGSKLTQVLRDSFVGGNKNKTCMIAMISPAINCVEHTLNTLRYADRVKELVAKDDDYQEANEATYEDQYVEEEPPAPLDNESDTEMYEEENADDEDMAHAVTLSSDDPLTTLNQSDANFDQSLTITDVAKQHEAMINGLQDFVRTFKDLSLRTNFEHYVSTLEKPFQELAALVNNTRDLVSTYNTQHCIKGLKLDENPEEYD